MSVHWYIAYDIIIALTRNSAERVIGGLIVTNYDLLFLEMLHDPKLKQDLLARLERIGLLAAFLEAANETTQGA